MLFWYFGHPLVYFWIMGAYVIWYNMIPTTYGGKVFSDPLTRLAFILLLLFSTPVGIHHQFLEPGDFRRLEVAARGADVWGRDSGVHDGLRAVRLVRAGGPARRTRRLHQHRALAAVKQIPTFSGAGLAMILFLFGGFGGLVNASYSMDILVHNTMWIVGHFHITVGGPVALTFIGAAYRLVPAVTGRKLWMPKLAVAQTWLWFVGMAIMSTAMHLSGLLGAPRRTADISYAGNDIAATWHPYMIAMAVGGTLLYISILMFVTVAVGTRFVNEPAETTFPFATVDEEHLAPSPVLDNPWRWSAVAIALCAGGKLGRPNRAEADQRPRLTPAPRATNAW